MGMFDYVDFEMDCPFCGNLICDFQTKSMKKMLNHYKPKDLGKNATMYSSCHECGSWIEFEYHRCNNRKEQEEQISRLNKKFNKGNIVK